MTDKKKSKTLEKAIQRLDEMEKTPSLFAEVFRRQHLEKGVVSFTTLPDFSKLSPNEKRRKIVFGLPWQAYNETNPDHGLLLIFDLLQATPFAYQVSAKTRERVREKIRRTVHKNYWRAFQHHLNELPGDVGPDERTAFEDVILCAIWADINTERFEPIWLAAMAQHAYWIEQNEYAFGYLVALLDQQRSNEPHFLRGQKAVVSASEGGKIRASKTRKSTDSVLAEMARLADNGQSISRAADLAYRNGFGASAGANKKLWYRHRTK